MDAVERVTVAGLFPLWVMWRRYSLMVSFFTLRMSVTPVDKSQLWNWVRSRI